MYKRMILIICSLTPFFLKISSIDLHYAVLKAFLTSSVIIMDVFLFVILVLLASFAKSTTLRMASIVPVLFLKPYCFKDIPPFWFSSSFSLPRTNLSNS